MEWNPHERRRDSRPEEPVSSCCSKPTRPYGEIAPPRLRDGGAFGVDQRRRLLERVAGATRLFEADRRLAAAGAQGAVGGALAEKHRDLRPPQASAVAGSLIRRLLLQSLYRAHP